MTSQALIDKYRNINVEDNWWAESVIDGFLDEMCPLGIKIDHKNIYWCISYSQGDGASFVADVDFHQFARTHNLLRERKHAQIQEDLFGDTVETWTPTSLEIYLTAGGEINVEMRRIDYRCTHEGTVAIDLEAQDNLEDILDVNQPLISYQVDQWQREMDDELDLLKLEARGILRGYMKELHNRLVDEYEYQTGDEAVRDWLEANEITEDAA